MAIIVLIHQPDGTYRPAVPGDVVVGQIFQWVRNGELSEVLKATGHPRPIYNDLNITQTWEIDSEPANNPPTTVEG
jgi:hypothetical protein